MSARTADRAYRGTALHTPVRGRVELLQDVLIVAGGDGRISAIHPADSPHAAELTRQFAAAGALTTCGDGQFLLPGLVDLHVHAPQWPQLGLALDLPLEEWLKTYTFPLEARYADVGFAERVYASLVDALLANGTTTALYFATIHLPATVRLAQLCLEKGQRALIGRVAMDDPSQCPPYYRDASAESADRDTRAFIAKVQSMSGNAAQMVRPVITPRFIPACSDELLQRLGALAQESGCHVQTHCSESDWAHRTVLERCGITDAAALEGFGLLTRHTILAHGNYVGDEDIARIAGHGAGIAHCPLSNAYLSDAVFPLRHILGRGVHVGLGSDIAGGSSPSILENVRHAVTVSHMLEAGVDPSVPRAARGRAGSSIDALTAFWLATAGGGVALGLPVGVFREGYQFDAMLIDGGVRDSNLRPLRTDSPEEILQKIVHHAARANIREVWVANRRVHALDAP